MIHSVTDAFQLGNNQKTMRHSSMFSSSVSGNYEPTLINPSTISPDDNGTDNKNMKKQQKIKSIALPFALFPESLLEFTDDSNHAMAGNYGFDPLNICRNSDDVMYYREAEIRHSRLAMLVSLSYCMQKYR
jgi:hypothetical protein